MYLHRERVISIFSKALKHYSIFNGRDEHHQFMESFIFVNATRIIF